MTLCLYSKCQKSFTPFRSNHRYCSVLCGQRDREFKNRDRQREKRAEAWRKKQLEKSLILKTE